MRDFTPYIPKNNEPLSVEKIMDITKSFENTGILVTNNSGFRGSEVKNVVSFFELGDKYHRQKKRNEKRKIKRTNY